MKRRLRLVALALVLLLVVGGLFGIPIFDRKVLAKRAVTDAVAAFNKRDWQKAEDHYTTAIRKLPESDDRGQRAFLASVYYRRGIVRFEMKKHAEVVEDCTRAIEILPAYSQAHLLRGITKLKMRQFADADRDFEESLRTNKNSSLSAYAAGICAEHQGNHQKALDYYRLALELTHEFSADRDEASDARYYAAVSRVLATLGDKTAAESAAQRARKAYPKVSFELPRLDEISRDLE